MLPTNYIEGRKLLLSNWPLYGMYAMAAGDPIFTDTIPTAATDGLHIFFSPTFLHRLPVPHVAAVLAHECIHMMKKDPDFMARKMWHDGTPILDLRKLNQSQDHWANLRMEDEGFQFPNIGICNDRQYRDMSVRQIYDLLPDPPPQPSGGGGQGQPDPLGNPCQGKGGLAGGDDVIAKTLTPTEIAEHRINTQQAVAAAQGMGKLPGWANQYVKKLSRPRVQFKDFFEPWLRDALDKDDITYRRLNRHYLPDFFAPTMIGTSFGNLIFGLDTSGSCWDQSTRFLSLTNTALSQLRPCTSTLLQFDAAIQGPPTIFGPSETIESQGRDIKIYGGGGTSFVPIFDWIHKELHDAIDGLIMLTDLMGDFPPKAPPYPVLWVCINEHHKAPFGTTFHFNAGLADD